MKRKLIAVVAAFAGMLTFASCDSKLCYCYEGGYETEVYISPDLPCNSMTNSSRGCVEREERMNTGDIAYLPAPTKR